MVIKILHHKGRGVFSYMNNYDFVFLGHVWAVLYEICDNPSQKEIHITEVKPDETWYKVVSTGCSESWIRYIVNNRNIELCAETLRNVFDGTIPDTFYIKLV